MSELFEFCCAHDSLFLVPIEELSASGISASYARHLCERRGISPEWIELFDRAFALYWTRALELAARDPRHWLPPRVQDVCVVLDPTRVRPFFQPLGRSSCLVDHGDFEPRTSSLEFAAYQFFLVERMALLGQVAPAVVHDLGYWLLRTREELADFEAGCRRARNGEAHGFRALAKAMEWIPRLHHETLRPPPRIASEPCTPLAGTGVLLPQRLRGELEGLVRRWTGAAEARVSAFRAAHAHRSGGEADELVERLRAERPLLLVTGRGGEILWDPESPERVDRVRAELGRITSSAARRLQEDWSVVSARSRAFLESLVRPDELPAPPASIDQHGLSYIHRERKLVAYGLHESGAERMREPAPPFEGWMLGARTIHEWGHLAVDAGWVPVPLHRQDELDRARSELAELFEAIVAGAPAALRAHAAGELAVLRDSPGGIGHGLVAIPLERMSDWQSNLLAQRYLPRVESETYVRNNVRSLLRELPATRLFQALARYAFEYQYLAFGLPRDARRYFLSSTWFGEQFLARQVLDEAQLDRLLELVTRLCRCHEVDESRFK